jgi:hypothetical protein
MGLCLAAPSKAADKDKKDAAEGKDASAVIVIRLDASKVSPDEYKKLMELVGKCCCEKCKMAKMKAKMAEKGADADEKGEKGKTNIVEVDLNKLPPELAQRLKEELAKSKGGGK